LSSRRTPGGGFTFEVQQLLAEDLCRGFVSETFARRIVVSADAGIEVGVIEICKVCLSGQKPSQSSDSVFD
jgi:hypothetical protein